MNPVIVATVACQSPHPRGANIPQIADPIDSRIEFSIPTGWSDQLYDDRNQINAHATKMIVPAFLMNAFALSPVLNITVFKPGMW